MGLGGAAIWIPSPRVASAALPPHRRGLAAGLVGMGIGIGIVFAGRLSDTLRHGQGDESWRDVYRVEGLIGVGVLLAALVLLRHRELAEPVADPAVAADYAIDAAAPAATAQARAIVDTTSAAAGIGGFATLRRIHGWLALTAAYAAFGFMYLLVFAFLVARLEDDSGFTADRASAMFSVVGVAAIFGGILLGPLSDRIGRRATMVGSFAAFGVSALAILPGGETWILLGSIGVGLSFSGLPAVIAAYVVDATSATTYGPAYSAATLAFGVAQVSAPQVGGLIADWQNSFTLVFVLSAVVAAAGAVFSWRLPDPRRALRHTTQPVG